jgi:hypothetical protein
VESSVVAGWDLDAFRYQNGKFSHCVTTVRYGQVTYLMFSVDSSFSWRMSLQGTWKLTPGAKFLMVYSLDDGPKLSATAVAISENQAVIPLTNSVALFQAFRRARILKFETAQGAIIPFDLTNSSLALDAALECTRRWTSAGQQAARPPERSQPSVYVRPETLRATASSFLAEAGITDFKFLPLTDEDFELAWEYSDQTRATFAVIRPEAAVSMERLLALTIERDTRLCKGQYQSGYMAPKYHMGSEIRRVFTACVDGARKFTYTYSVVQLPSGALMRLGSNAFGDVASGSTTLLPRSERIEEVGLRTVGARY